MKIAYLIDREAVGGGMEYIRRQIAAHPRDETRVFASCRGECTAAKVNAWGADVVHANHLRALLQLFRSPFARPRGEVVFTVHGIHLRKYDFLPRTAKNRLLRAARLALERRLYRRCGRIIALTETDAADIRRLYGADLPVEVVPNTVDASEFAADFRMCYRRDEFAFACIARFDFQKGQDVLVAAAQAAQTELRRTRKRILMVGGGATFARTKADAFSRGVAD
ncbi:MAG: glycosyltransferase, partial [Kiritimatiellae bacterium]|nr:glycosyltransferase [Kiritimatiellia bacterium]